MSSVPILCRLRPPLVHSTNHIVDFLVTGFYSPHNLSRFHPLERKDFVEFAFELCNKRFLVVFGPWPPLWVSVLWGGITFVGGFESVFEVVIGYVVVIVVFE